MSSIIKLRRGLASVVDSTVAYEGELMYATDTKQLRIGDGTTAGGKAIASIGDVQNIQSQLQTQLQTVIPQNGDRGVVAGYERVGSETTISETSADSNEVSANITVKNGSTGTSQTKIVRTTAAVTITLESGWHWQDNEAPTITAGGILICCWCGSGGIAQFIN